MNASIFLVLVCLLFACFNKYGFRLFSKMTWQCWAFAHKHCTFNGFIVLFKNLQIRVGCLFEKQFIVCNFKVTICVALCRLMGRLGEVLAHGGSTVSQILLHFLSDFEWIWVLRWLFHKMEVLLLYGTVNGELKFIQNRSKNRFWGKRTTIHHRQGNSTFIYHWFIYIVSDTSL